MDQPRRALITGTSAGLGRAIAVALAREGYDLALTELSVDALKDTLAEPEIKKRKAVAIALDLRSQDSIKAAFERATKELGDLDLLVNNAGRALLKPVADVTEAEWDDVIDTNLKGAFFLSQLFGRHCIARNRPGVIVSMASTHGMTGIAGRSVYGISKAGLIQMTRMLAIEWADKNIRVNAIAPTTVMTESRQQMLSDPDKRAAALSRIPSGRFATPEEIAAAVVYLASPGAASVTGHTLPVDGGTATADLAHAHIGWPATPGVRRPRGAHGLRRVGRVDRRIGQAIDQSAHGDQNHQAHQNPQRHIVPAGLLGQPVRIGHKRLLYGEITADRSDRFPAGTRPAYAAADLPIAALTRGSTCSAINSIERLASAGSTQSMPA